MADTEEKGMDRINRIFQDLQDRVWNEKKSC